MSKEKLLTQPVSILPDIDEPRRARRAEGGALKSTPAGTLLAEDAGTGLSIDASVLPNDRCLHQLFEAAAQSCPHAVAVSCGGLELTYAELDSRSNQLARYLTSRGVGPESLVGICMERTAEMLVGLLAILKAGAAYLPLDPAYPPERMAFMLKDARARAVLTETSLVEAIPESTDTPVITLDAEREAIGAESDARMATRVTPENVAYVIYTSGSTGQPKGVQITHRNVLRLLTSTEPLFGFNSSDVWTLFHSYAFDFSVWEIWGALAYGGRLVVVPYLVSRSPVEFYELLRRERVTVLNQTPSAFRQLMDVDEARGSELSLRFVIFGGEALDPRSLMGWFERHGDRSPQLVNMYGITETTVHVTYYPVRQADSTGGTSVIGQPIADLQAYVLDEQLEPVPVGVAGHLHIGGEGLARGYFNRPELTSERFIPNPFSVEPGSRLYRSGDRARFLESGELEYLGRLDNQVKIRGFRVELGEIESALREHEEVKDCVVLMREDVAGDKRLVAYLVLREQESEPDASVWRSYLQQRLPEYMVPQAFVALEKMPLTASGKVDRRALPAPSEERVTGREYVAPRNNVEEEISRIWSEVLRVERVGVEDNFFELGGHSLLATQVTYRIRDAFQVDVPLHMLFEAPNLAELAAAVSELQAEQEKDEKQATPLLAIVPAPEERHEPFPLSEQQRAYWIGRGDAFELGNVACHIYFDLASTGLNLGRLNTAWRKLIERHDMLRAIVLEDGRQQVLEEVPEYRIEVADLRGQSEQMVEAELAETRERMSHQVHAPDVWPLFEIKAFRLDDERVRLHVNFDLLIVDGVSIVILFKEWEQLYLNPDAELEPLEFSFRDYVLADIAAKETARFETSRQYWMERVDSLPPAPELPIVKSPSAITKPRFERQNTVLDAHTHQTVMDEETWSRLKAKGRARGLTPSVILCAAYAEVLERWSHSPRFTLNVTAFGRLPVHPQINRVVGDFTTLTLLEVDATAEQSFERRAQRLQQRLWQDLEHRHFSGLKVMQELALREGGAVGSAAMPVVFTSLLEDFSVIDWLGDVTFSITNTPQVWIDNVAMERGGALAFHWDAVSELFPEGMLRDMFEAYSKLLERLAGDEQAWTLNRLVSLPPAQLELRETVNRTEAPLPNVLAHDGFLEQVSLRPEQPAVITSSISLTYEELARRAASVSHWLLGRGAEPNRLVAIVMEKGWEQIVAVMGVLQAGAAYLPLDAELPKERLAHLLDNAQVELVLTQGSVDERLDWASHIERLRVDEDEATDALSLSDLSAQRAAPEDLAYVIYTSGSTGAPKGVMIEHRSVVNMVRDINERFQVGPEDRAIAISSLSFDLSVYDVFGMLSAGGAIVIPDAKSLREPKHWAELAKRERVTLWNSVPALLGLMVEHLETTREAALSSLRLAMMSGDWIPVSLPERIKRVAPGASPISLGGPTETTVWNICHPVEEADAGRKSIPYGKPLSNCRYYVLNESLEDCPAWVTGEMYCAGACVSRGYWRDAERTAEKFVYDARRGERLYRTGDLGRYLPDGNIEFVGRADYQVKVQGNRIELGEVESALKEHPLVSQAVVTVQGARDGDRRLVAFIVPEAGVMPATAELQEHLRRKLPQYMVPGVYAKIEKLPLSANGKVNRRALQEMKDVATSLPASQAASSSGTSMLADIAGIVSEILKIERVDPDARLMELGAASIEIMRLGGMLQKKFGFRPEMGQLFRLPTTRAIAEFYESSLVKSSSATGPAIGGGSGEEARASAVLAKTPLLFDPKQRAQFKKSRPGQRRLSQDTTLIDLATPETYDSQVELYRRRRSHRSFSKEPVTIEELAGLLNCLSEISLKGQPKYRYGSAGGLYPVQTYLYVAENRVEGLAEGVYYYHPGTRQLALISERARIDRNIHFHYNRPIFDEAAFTIFLVAEMNAVTPMYGKISLKYALIEAGAMTHLLETTGPDYGLGLCQVGEVEFEEARSLLNLEESHVLLHTVLGGRDARVTVEREREAEVTSSATGQLSSTAQMTVTPDAAGRHEAFPLMVIQQAIWIGRNAHYDMGNVSTHVYYEFESTHLDLERLNRAWRKLVERHDMLRAIVLEDGRQQVLEEVPEYQIEVVDLRGKPQEFVDERLAETRERMSHQMLKPDAWPLFENMAHLLDGGRILLHVSIDSQFVDALSENIIFSELLDFYNDPDLALAPLELTFRDCVLAETALRETDAYRKSRDYWLARVPALPPAPQLPLVKNPNALKRPKFVRYDGVLQPEEWQKLKALCGQSGLTPSVVICAAFSAVLATWSRSQHMTLNLTLYNRPPLHPQVNEIIGQFTGVSLLEVDFRRDESFAEFARSVQHQLWEDLEHRHFNGVEVLRELARHQGAAPHAMMPVVLTSMLNQPARSPNGTPLRWLGEVEYSISQAPQVWIEHDVSERDGTLSFYWDCVEELFPDGLLSDMFSAYCHLLERLIVEPDAWTGRTPALIPAAQLEERAAVNKTDAPIPDELLHTLFAAQAETRGTEPAVITPSRTLSYAELYRMANQAGHWLRHLNVKPNRLVAIVMEKGWEQIVAVMGVLQAGAAYLPLDAELPKERLAYLLENSQVELVLTQPHLYEKIEWPESVRRLRIDEERLSAWSSEPLDAAQGQDDLAFVIYTSGSTGSPKGVMITHRGAVNAVTDTNRRFNVGPQDRTLALTALHHDMSAFDIFGLLTAGGALVMPEAAERRNPAHWLELMNSAEVTIWNSVPAMMSMFLEHVEARELALASTLRLAFLGGDWIPLDTPERLRALAPSAQLVSVGGPTETTIWNICYPVTETDPSWKSIPYGKPFSNARYYVLNEKLEDCPAWVTGEMYCAGAGVAGGYWRDEERTAEKFIYDERRGERLYRTGDLGRYLPDGNIEFMGRADYQVKVQGNRIELGEVESALTQHPYVAHAIVTAAGELRGEKRLIAYYVLRNGQEPSSEQLREFLKGKLPQYMVPGVYVKIEELPLSANGKVNRRALPAPEQLSSLNERGFVEPRNPVERQVTAIFSRVLKCDEVSIYHDFFALGGNSLTAIQLIARLRDEFEVEVPLVELFDNPTVAHLSETIMTMQIEEADGSEVAALLAELEQLSDEETEALLRDAQSQERNL
ncbi:MAG TPA: amino acid adenylation domain-containing protein [Pyrinomonadaceae bacterium]|nr:amino acid adenylation domain-containing protein [Pyrinomonadaceae bacterium]